MISFQTEQKRKPITRSEQLPPGNSHTSLCHGVFTYQFSFRHILYLRPSQSTFRPQREKRKC